MTPENHPSRRLLWWCAGLFSVFTFGVSWWHWWTFQYGTFDLAFYVQALWLALRGQWQVSLLNVPLMGNHAEPIVFLLTPLFALWPHAMLFVAAQTLAFATMPFTAYRIGRRLALEPRAATFMALATLLTPASFSIAIYEFHPEALAAPLLLLLIEARLAGRRGWFWVWFIATLGVKENIALLLIAFCGVFFLLEWKRGRRWQLTWNLLPMGLAAGWLLYYAKVMSPALNAGNVDYLQLYGHLGKTPGDIVRNFFVEPQRALGALKNALLHGNMLGALLLPMLCLPVLRPRWLLIAAPVLLQHLLSYRFTEWSLGAHYPAPFIPLFWMAAAEGLSRLRGQTTIAALVVGACLLAHLRFGEARPTLAELQDASVLLQERELKAQLIADLPPGASVVAGLGFLPHLATREHLVSLHHIIKGLKTLSTATYTPPPVGDAVVIDYADRLTFNTVAGYYHPWSHLPDGQFLPSSDRLLHDYLQQATWTVRTANSTTVYRRGTPLAPIPIEATGGKIDETTTLTGIEVTKSLPGSLQLRLSWQLTGERMKFPWLVLVLSDGQKLYPILKGACAIEAGEGQFQEEWTVIFPDWIHPGRYQFVAQFYDGNLAACARRIPPADRTFVSLAIDFGSWDIEPGTPGTPASTAQEDFSRPPER